MLIFQNSNPFIPSTHYEVLYPLPQWLITHVLILSICMKKMLLLILEFSKHINKDLIKKNLLKRLYSFIMEQTCHKNGTKKPKP